MYAVLLRPHLYYRGFNFITALYKQPQSKKPQFSLIVVTLIDIFFALFTYIGIGRMIFQ